MPLDPKAGLEDLHQRPEETAGTLCRDAQMFSQFQGLGRKSSLRHSMTAQLIYTSREKLDTHDKLGLIVQNDTVSHPPLA